MPTVVDRLPTPDECRAPCRAVGWGEIVNLDVAADALAGSLAGCVAVAGEDVVGMARLVGDGAIFFYVQDVAVAPAHQGSGIGALLLDRLLQRVDEHAPPRAFVGLFAVPGTEPFYRCEGFEAHEGLVGMFQVTPRVRR